MRIKLYKNDRILLAGELLFLLVYIILMCGRRNVYEFDASNLEIYQDQVIYAPEEGSYTILGDGDWSQTGAMIGIARMEIARGAYEIEVRYSSNTGINGQTGSCENYAGSLQIRSYANPTEVGCNPVQLVDGDNVATDRLWITSPGSIRDLDVKVYFNGFGILKIEGIVFRELLIWRVTCVLKWIFIFCAVDFCYFYFVRRNAYKDKHIVLGLLFMIVFSSLLSFQDYVIGGHDLPFHLSRILSIAKSLAAGQWISPIQADMANGYGYAAPIFYGQVFLYLPAVLYNMAVPLHVCYQIYVVCVNIATCLVSYFCFRAVAGKKEIALIGAYCYQLSAYRVIDVYIRAALGEYTAMIFLPLVLYGFYKVYTAQAKRLTVRDTACIVFGLTGIIQSHLITIELTAFFVVVLCVVLFRKTFEMRRFLVLAEAAGLTLLCNLGFLLPLCDSMKMDIAVNAKTMGNLQELGASLYQVFGVFMHPDGTCTLGIGLALGVILFCWCFVKRFEWGLEGNIFLKAGVIAFGMFVFAVLASLSAFPWDSLATADGLAGALGKIACVIQFPWRFLTIATILSVFLTVLGIAVLCGCGRERYGYTAGVVIAFVLTLNAGLFDVQYPDIAMTTKQYASIDKEVSVRLVSGGEYRLVDTDFELCKTKEVVAGTDVIEIADYQSGQKETLLVCANHGDEPGYVEIPLFCYDNYRAYDRESGAAVPLECGTNNRIRLSIAGGYQGSIRVVYEIPLLWKLSYLVSALTMLGMTVYLLAQHRFGGQNNEPL